MKPRVSRFNTFFLFPFSIDKEAVLEDHPDLWPNGRVWFEGLDEWVAAHDQHENALIPESIGPWRRAAYTRFELDSPAYENMIAFHPFVRRVFFDANDPACAGEEGESLLATYVIPLTGQRRLFLNAEDTLGGSGRIEITSLRLFLFANGIGILSIGVEGREMLVQEALWVNNMMRKVFPANQRQITEGRAPKSLALVMEEEGRETIMAQERFEKAALRGYQPPLSRTIRTLLYFIDYGRQEYEQVLDERMLVYSYMALSADTLADTVQDKSEMSRELQVLLSRYMYVDRYGDDLRYDADFLGEAMKRHVYRRWAHQGTYYGFTSYSSVALTLSSSSPDSTAPDAVVHRMFGSRYYMLAIIALFYRATLLDFSEQTALVSKRIYLDQADGSLTTDSIRLVNKLRADFLHFSNYWFFQELANKDEEMQHFELQREVYRLESLKRETEQEIEKLNTWLQEYYQMQSATAVNRLAISSMILGAGAVITGYFGMNFQREFGRYFFEPDGGTPTFVHYGVIIAVTGFALTALAFSFYIIASSWDEFRHFLLPRRLNKQAERSLRRSSPARTTQ